MRPRLVALQVAAQAAAYLRSHPLDPRGRIVKVVAKDGSIREITRLQWSIEQLEKKLIEEGVEIGVENSGHVVRRCPCGLPFRTKTVGRRRTLCERCAPRNPRCPKCGGKVSAISYKPQRVKKRKGEPAICNRCSLVAMRSTRIAPEERRRIERERNARNSKRRVAQGKCSRCSSPQEPGKQMCRRHLSSNREAGIKSRSKASVAGRKARRA